MTPLADVRSKKYSSDKYRLDLADLTRQRKEIEQEKEDLAKLRAELEGEKKELMQMQAQLEQERLAFEKQKRDAGFEGNIP